MSAALPVAAKTAANLSPTLQVAKMGSGLLQQAVTPQMQKPQVVNNLVQPSFSMTPPSSMGARAAFPGLTNQTSTPNAIGGAKQMQMPAQSPSPSSIKYGTNGLGMNGSVGTPVAGYNQPSQGAPQQQSQQQYSAPAQTAAPQFNASAFTNTPQMQQVQQSQQMPQMADNSYAGLIQQLIQQTQMSPEEQALRQQAGQLQSNLAEKLAGNALNPIGLEFQTGRANILNNLAANKQAALQAQIQSAQKEREIASGVYSSAVTAMQPRTLQGGQYQVSPTGQEIGSGFAGGLDRQRQVDNYNYNTQTGQNFAKQAAELEQPMQALHLVGQQVAQFIQQNGLNNQTSPMANQAINTYLAQANPAAYTSLVAAGTEAKNLIARIAGMGSDLVPTELTNAANSMNIENMTARDIQAFIEAVDALGQSRLSTMQSSAQASQSSGYQPYSGQTQGNPQAQLPSTPMPQYLMGNVPTTQNPLAQGGIGAGIGAGGNILAAGGAIVGFFSKLFK